MARRAAWLGGVALAAYLCFWPVPIEPIPWTPPPSPGLTGPYARNDALAAAELLSLGRGFGPETVAFGPDGQLYVALRDGRIVRRSPEPGANGAGAAEPETFADTGGSPGGLAFDARGHLIVADADRGLLDVAPDGAIAVLVSHVDGRRMLFPDAVAIASDGVVWFTDGSQRFPEHHDAYEFLEGRGTGRLLTYDPATGATRVRLDGLHFANGVALGPGEAYVLVNETAGYRTTRLWLAGPRAGTTDVFAGDYPGHPDNVTFDGRDRFWIGLVYHRDPRLDWLRAQSGFWKKLVLRLPLVETLAGPGKEGFAIGLDLEGNVVANLQDPTGRVVAVTHVVRRDGWIYLGSLTMSAVARVPVPGPGEATSLDAGPVASGRRLPGGAPEESQR
jgi:sugar lactone lactonase YvrE